MALWTPTDAEGSLLEHELRAHLNFLRGQNVQGILALGSTGEFLHLDLPVRKRLLEIVAEEAGPLAVLANISDIRPRAVAELGRFAQDLQLSAVAVLPPHFFPLAQSDLEEFFVRAGDAAQLPLFLYNFPERTGNRIALETVAAVADRSSLAGVKQSGAEFQYHRQLVELGRRKNFVVFTGGEPRLAEAMALGVTGCVSGLANAVPEMVVDIFEFAGGRRAGNLEEAVRRMQRLGALVDQIEFPLNVAAAIEARGLPTGEPKSVVSAGTRARYEQLVHDLRGLYREWQLI